MDSTNQMGLLREFAEALAAEHGTEPVLGVALPRLLPIAMADAALVLQLEEEVRVVSSAGAELDHEALRTVLAAASSELTDLEVPASWGRAGVVRTAARRLPGEAGVLVLAWCAPATVEDSALRLAVAYLESRLATTARAEPLTALVARTDHAQRLANMGDFEWHIATDRSSWSDQLFRIYGYEPQSFAPRYDTFLAHVHPDDRERIARVHEEACATGAAYEVIERIVRPGGEVRHLSSTGEVVMDEDGNPVRLRGTCVDITDRARADQECLRVTTRFRGLVNAAPDAILLLDAEGRVLEANERARELLDGDPEGHPVDEFLPAWPRTHGGAVHASSLRGLPLKLDVISVSVPTAEGLDSDEDVLDALFLRDAGPRLEGEGVSARLNEAQLKRRQALEINDNVVQGLVAAVYSLDQGEVQGTKAYLDRTLTAARTMMDDLLDSLDGVALQPGDLVRTGPALLGTNDAAPHPPPRDSEPRRTHSVLVVDDAEDLRLLMRTRMEAVGGLSVVGEAADGVAAVEMATLLQPDLVLLDLAMPRMDGLEALPLIRAAVRGVRVIVLSGFNQSALAQKALEAGADHYVVKGGSMDRLLQLIDSLLEPAS